MSRKKIKNPLIKRIPKEIIGDWKKYLVVFLFLVLTIGFVSGMYVANDSMLTSADEGVSKYKQEDGHFELKDKADSELVTAIESGSNQCQSSSLAAALDNYIFTIPFGQRSQEIDTAYTTQIDTFHIIIIVVLQPVI